MYVALHAVNALWFSRRRLVSSNIHVFSSFCFTYLSTSMTSICEKRQTDHSLYPNVTIVIDLLPVLFASVNYVYILFRIHSGLG